MFELLEKLLPILILILIGVFARKTKMLSEEIVIGLKNIIIKIALPVVLFKSFATVNLELSFVWLFLLIFIYCVILYIVGEGLKKVAPKIFSKEFTGGYFTGFEFGMIGVGLFGAIWGIEKLPIIMLVGFGHEIFIWFVYLPLLSKKGEGSFDILGTVKEIIKTPTIIGIVIGIIFNLFNIYEGFGNNLLGASIYATIEFLMPLTSPLILLIIGYSMTFGKLDVKKALIYIVARWVVVLGIGIPLLIFIQSVIKGLDPLFTQAYLAFIILPAPYILPLIIKDKVESEFFSQVLVYSTLTSFVGYIILLGMAL